MAAVAIPIAIATTRLAALSPLSAKNFTRNGALPHLKASAPCSLFGSVSLVRRSSVSAALAGRAAEVGNGEVAAEYVEGSKLYVGNLPWTCDSEQLAGLLSEVGAVEEVEVVYDQDTGRSRGFAFVTMASDEDARAAIAALDGSDLGGRALRVNFPKPSKNNPRVLNPGRTRPGNVNKMFVGNLVWSCEREGLVELFSRHGEVVEAKVVYDKDTGRSRGFGFVTMNSAAEVDAAIAHLSGTDFLGRLLRVDKVETRRERE